MRNAFAFVSMIIGPVAIMLVYMHFFRSLGPQPDFDDIAACIIAVVVGGVGAFLLGARPISSRIIGVFAYLIIMVFVMPIVALLSVCTTGDCL